MEDLRYNICEWFADWRVPYARLQHKAAPDELFSARQIADALKTEQNAAMLAELPAQNERFGLGRNSTVILYGTCSQCKGS